MNSRIAAKLHNDALTSTVQLYNSEIKNMIEFLKEEFNPRMSNSTKSLVKSLKIVDGQFSFLAKMLQNSQNPRAVKLKFSRFLEQ